MPNGGSDCCGTCCFNSANEGAAKYASGERPNRCTIRAVTIDDPYWTYCANHPHHNPDRIDVPVGPIYVESGGGFPYRRKVLVDSPDTEAIRLTLLASLHAIEELPKPEYPTSTKWDETTILQLELFREPRAVDRLRRIASFDPFATSESDDAFRRNRVSTVARAIEALTRILSDDAAEDLRRCILLGRDAAKPRTDDDKADDPLAEIRFFAVQSLDQCSTGVAKDLAFLALDDPDEEVAELARGFAGDESR